MFKVNHIVIPTHYHRCGALPKNRAELHHSASSDKAAVCRTSFELSMFAWPGAGYSIASLITSFLYPFVVVQALRTVLVRLEQH